MLPIHPGSAGGSGRNPDLKDAYNWGYDPDHYLAPEGSYAVNPDQRVKEYREMVMGLHGAGLRVIQDVVFNHTSGFGEASNSILDEVVPELLQPSRHADGNLETGSCCADTATEHVMMGKLQQDAVLWNARRSTRSTASALTS